jgi:hypothetical protein
MKFTGLVTVMLITGGIAVAQSSGRMTRSEYFETYKEMAIHEMHRSGVPASITLAQGALESGDGNSRLARNGNNHFGIKCHNDWNGKKMYEDDDHPNECFRKYGSVEDSYRDHSDYLRTKERYAFLFDLNPADYKAWARGLKKAGYATSPTYADKLIQIIEEYDLHRFDLMEENTRVHHRKSAVDLNSRQILENNRVKYLLAREGDTYETLTAELGKLKWELPEYNEAGAGDPLLPGQVVYIQPKRKKAGAGKNEHVVKEGETLHSIAHLYAIKVSGLCAMNRMDPATIPAPGTVLQLRKHIRHTLPQPATEELPGGGEEEEEIKVDLNLE